ncbi:MAG: nitroreductase/quinone reductase family protein, partial [Gammaproteobacteria bacterium]
MNDPKPITEAHLKIMKPMMLAFPGLNVWIYELFGGLMMNRLSGGDVCLVKMTGTKPGEVKEIPLICVPCNDGVILIASMAGSPKHPAWYYNLVAHTEIEVTVHGQAMQLVARQANDKEEAVIWPRRCEHYSDLDLYQRLTPR